MRILDCTFRDGGYQTDWHFPRDLVNKYLWSMKDSNVDLVELGFRSPIESTTSGAHAYTSDKYIESLDIPNGIDIGVMINAKEFISSGAISRELINKLFRASQQNIAFVRIASDFQHINFALEINDVLKDMGYAVHVNLMRASDLNLGSDSDSLLSIESLLKRHELSNLTIADTYGALTPAKTQLTISTLMGITDAHIGVHMHDNMGLAFANTLSAISAGAEFVDATVTGIGRGPGNLRTEFLGSVSEASDYVFDDLLLLAAERFEELKKIHNWGASSLYYLAAENRIHPSYIQELTSGNRYEIKNILKAVKLLAERNSGSYSYISLEEVTSTNLDLTSDDSLANESLQEGWCQDEDVILLGSGISLEYVRDSIAGLLEGNDDFHVVAMNLKPMIDPKFIKTYILSDRLKYSMDEVLHVRNSILIAPFRVGQQIEGFQFVAPKDKTETFAGKSRINALSYALDVLEFGKPKNIFLAGFDGYSDNNSRHEENQSIITEYLNRAKYNLFIGTPSLYEGPRRSIYTLFA